jgi:hypothetical protein
MRSVVQALGMLAALLDAEVIRDVDRGVDMAAAVDAKAERSRRKRRRNKQLDMFTKNAGEKGRGRAT